MIEGKLRHSPHPEQGMEVSPLTLEFGPYPYMLTLPFKNEPVADLNVICNWMATRQSERPA